MVRAWFRLCHLRTNVLRVAIRQDWVVELSADPQPLAHAGRHFAIKTDYQARVRSYRRILVMA